MGFIDCVKSVIQSALNVLKEGKLFEGVKEVKEFNFNKLSSAFSIKNPVNVKSISLQLDYYYALLLISIVFSTVFNELFHLIFYFSISAIIEFIITLIGGVFIGLLSGSLLKLLFSSNIRFTSDWYKVILVISLLSVFSAAKDVVGSLFILSVISIIVSLFELYVSMLFLSIFLNINECNTEENINVDNNSINSDNSNPEYLQIVGEIAEEEEVEEAVEKAAEENNVDLEAEVDIFEDEEIEVKVAENLENMTVKQCKKCGTVITKETSKFCENCGEELK